MRASRERRLLAGAMLTVGATVPWLLGCSKGPEVSGAPGATQAPPTTGQAEVGRTIGTPPSAPTTVGAVATTTPRWTPEQQEVIDAYQRAIAVEIQAQTSGEPSSDDLAATHADPMLQKTKDFLHAERLAGHGARPATPSRTRAVPLDVELIDEMTATVRDCSVDDGVVFDKNTGNVINDRVTTAVRLSTLRRVAGNWKLADRSIEQRWEEETGCAESN